MSKAKNPGYHKIEAVKREASAKEYARLERKDSVRRANCSHENWSINMHGEEECDDCEALLEVEV